MIEQAKFILSKSELKKQYSQLCTLCNKISYSAKTNYEVAKVLEETTDCWFTMHSLESLSKIEDKSRVLFFAQAWDKIELDELFSLNISKFVVDNKEDLKVLLGYIQLKKKKITLFLRIRLKENTIHTGKYFVFGMYSDEANKLVSELKNNPCIEQLGIHFHRKTQNIGEWSLKEELEQALTEETLRSISIMNIGGGIPVKYKNFTSDVLNPIFDEIKKLHKWLKPYDIQMIIEPGRFLAASCVKLQAKIMNIYRNNIIINCSVYNTAMDTFVAHIRLQVENELPDNKGTAFTIKGKTPCSMDIFRYRVFLGSPKVGDTITFLNAGAYNYSSDFCCLEKLPTEIVD